MRTTSGQLSGADDDRGSSLAKMVFGPPSISTIEAYPITQKTLHELEERLPEKQKIIDALASDFSALANRISALENA